MDDIEAIKQLKARYFRTLDTKDWDEMRRVFTDDVVVDTTPSGGEVHVGADVFITYIRGHLADIVTVHHGHMPEITVTSPSTATGIWAMEGRVAFPGRDLNGFGHYLETYEKVDGEWRIRTMTLTRLRTDVAEQP